jgi:hypothetical protein
VEIGVGSGNGAAVAVEEEVWLEGEKDKLWENGVGSRGSSSGTSLVLLSVGIGEGRSCKADCLEGIIKKRVKRKDAELSGWRRRFGGIRMCTGTDAGNNN